DRMQRHRQQRRADRAAKDQEDLAGLEIRAHLPMGAMKHRIENRSPGEQQSENRGQVHGTPSLGERLGIRAFGAGSARLISSSARGAWGIERLSGVSLA